MITLGHMIGSGAGVSGKSNVTFFFTPLFSLLSCLVASTNFVSSVICCCTLAFGLPLTALVKSESATMSLSVGVTSGLVIYRCRKNHPVGYAFGPGFLYIHQLTSIVFWGCAQVPSFGCSDCPCMSFLWSFMNLHCTAHWS